MPLLYGMKYSKEILAPLVECSSSYSDVLRRLNLQITGGNQKNLKKNLQRFGLSVIHFRATSGGKVSWNKKTANQILIHNPLMRNRLDTNQLRRALKEIGVKECCSECGNCGEWRGKKLVLEVDHKDGDWRNNKADNIHFLCPNCHSQTWNYYNHTHQSKCECGQYKYCRAKECSKCSKKTRGMKIRKVKIRPSHEDLLQQIEKLGYCGVGKIYGVSDNAIRKWVKRGHLAQG